MKTFYDVLNISEKVTKEEIDIAYKDLKQRYKSYLSDPFNSSKAEEKLKKIEIAYKVLGNEDNKAQYDRDLANMRNDELMSNLQKNTTTYNDEIRQKEEEERKREEEKRIAEEKLREEALEKEKLKLVQEEIDRQIQEQQKKLEIERKNQKKFQEMREKEYKSYLRKMGVNVKEPLTVKRFFKILFSTIIVLLVVFVVFQIPAVKNAILNNDAVKTVLELFN